MTNTAPKSDVLVVHPLFESKQKEVATNELREAMGLMIRMNEAYIEYKSYYPYNYLKNEIDEFMAANKKIDCPIKKGFNEVLININQYAAYRQDKRTDKRAWEKFEKLKENTTQTYNQLACLTAKELNKERDFALWYIELSKKQGKFGWLAYYELLWEIIATVSTDNLLFAKRKRSIKTKN